MKKLVSDNKERLASLRVEEQKSKEAVKSMKVDSDKTTRDFENQLEAAERRVADDGTAERALTKASHSHVK